MSRFSYTAYDQGGARSSGAIEAETREAAVEFLFRQGHYPLELVEGSVAQVPRWWERELLVSRGLSQRKLALLTRELATLVNAELPIDEALRIARLQPLMPKRTQQMIGQILDRVLEGASLSEALQTQGVSVPPYYAHIVRAGEAAGMLGPALDDLAGFLERKAEFRSQIGSALLYPALLLIAAAGTLLVIMTVLVPTIAPLFQEAGAPPPFVVQVLLDGQIAIAKHWFLAMVLAGSIASGLIAVLHNARWRLWWDRMVLRLPIVSSLVESGQTATMSKTLGTLIRNGVPLLQGLQITAEVLSNSAMAATLRDCANDVKEGATLASSLARGAVFPDLALRLTGVGEQTGQLDTMLERVGSIYEVALQQRLLRLTSLLTPLLTIAIGVLVGGLLLSVVGAIAGLNELALK